MNCHVAKLGLVHALHGCVVKIFSTSHIVFVCTRPKARFTPRIALRYTVSVGIPQGKAPGGSVGVSPVALFCSVN